MLGPWQTIACQRVYFARMPQCTLFEAICACIYIYSWISLDGLLRTKRAMCVLAAASGRLHYARKWLEAAISALTMMAMHRALYQVTRRAIRVRVRVCWHAGFLQACTLIVISSAILHEENQQTATFSPSTQR